MKKRYVPIITFTIAILLVGSIAYAADKRKKNKSVANDLNGISEDEALQAELLVTVEEQLIKLQATKAAISNETEDNMSVEMDVAIKK